MDKEIYIKFDAKEHEEPVIGIYKHKNGSMDNYAVTSFHSGKHYFNIMCSGVALSFDWKTYGVNKEDLLKAIKTHTFGDY